MISCILQVLELLIKKKNITGPRIVIIKTFFFFCLVYFAVHEILKLKGSNFQSLYHFTVGAPVLDKRIMSLPAYPGPSIDT